MYQAAQNVLVGFGAVCGASFGGVIADTIGWRWCFLLQVPVSILALVVGYLALKNPQQDMLLCYNGNAKIRSVLSTIDVSGAVLLVLTLLVQLLGLSMGGNELPWSSPWIISALSGSAVLLFAFMGVETFTSAIPVVPLRLLRGRLPAFVQITNIFAGMASYAVSCFHGMVCTSTDYWPVPLHASIILPGCP